MFQSKPLLFGEKIEPSCGYCEHGDIAKEGFTVFCKKKGIVSVTDNCRKFLYAPLKRVPKRPPVLGGKFENDDFDL